MSGGLLPGGLFSRGSFARGHFWPEGFLSGGAFVWGSFARGTLSPGVFWPGALLAGGLLAGGLMPVPPKFNAIDKQKNKHKDKLGPVAPRGVDPAPQIFSVCRGGGTLHISSKHCMGPTPFYGARAEKKTPKNRFGHEANEYMST